MDMESLLREKQPMEKEAKAALLAKFEAQAAQAAKATIDKALL